MEGQLLRLRGARDGPVPPFSLQDDLTYPARLEIEYPAHPSRSLVLVKWWLLAVPHYVVIGFFLGGGTNLGSQWGSGPGWIFAGGGLIGALVLVAAVVPLCTGRYRRAIFDLVIGVQRWVLCVAAYTALMTDTYPPFRVDQGDADSTPDTGTYGPFGQDPTRGPGEALPWRLHWLSTRSAVR